MKKTQQSGRRETVCLKQAPDRRVRILRVLLYAAAVALIAAGAANGGMRDVMIKAINICTECIGLG